VASSLMMLTETLCKGFLKKNWSEKKTDVEEKKGTEGWARRGERTNRDLPLYRVTPVTKHHAVKL